MRVCGGPSTTRDRRCIIPVGNVLGSWSCVLLVDYELWIGRSLKQSLEMHGIMELLLRPEDLVEAEVVVPLLERVEGDVSIELAQRMRC